MPNSSSNSSYGEHLSDFEKVVVQQGGATVVLLDVLASLSRQEVSFLAQPRTHTADHYQPVANVQFQAS